MSRQNKWSTFAFLFCCAELLSALLIFSVVVDWISFLMLNCSSNSFGVCTILSTGKFLAFSLTGDSSLQSIYNIKIYSRSFIWATFNSFITKYCIKFAKRVSLPGEGSFLLLISVSVDSRLNDVALI